MWLRWGELFVLDLFPFTLSVWQYYCDEYSLNGAPRGGSAVGSEKGLTGTFPISVQKQICHLFLLEFFFATGMEMDKKRKENRN